MKARIVKRADGGVSIIHPAPQSWRKKDKLKVIKEKVAGKEVDKIIIVAKAETEEEWLKRVLDKSMNGKLVGRPYEDVDESEIPSDREFREAWELDDTTKKIKVNPHKKDKIIKERNIAKKKNEILNKQAKQELGIDD